MSNVLNSIYALEPVNKTASLVTGQSGCHEELTDEQKFENMKSRAQQLIDYLTNCGLKKSDPKRKKVAEDYHKLCLDIKSIRESLNLKPRARDVSPFFLLVAKQILTKFEYNKIMSEAVKLGIQHDFCTDRMKDNSDG